MSRGGGFHLISHFFNGALILRKVPIGSLAICAIRLCRTCIVIVNTFLITFWPWLQNRQDQFQKARFDDFVALSPEEDKTKPREVSIWCLSGPADSNPWFWTLPKPQNHNMYTLPKPIIFSMVVYFPLDFVVYVSVKHSPKRESSIQKYKKLKRENIKTCSKSINTSVVGFQVGQVGQN